MTMASTNMPPSSVGLDSALANVPSKFRGRIIDAYTAIKRRHRGVESSCNSQAKKKDGLPEDA